MPKIKSKTNKEKEMLATIEKQKMDIEYYKECIKGLQKYIDELERFYSPEYMEGDDLR